MAPATRQLSENVLWPLPEQNPGYVLYWTPLYSIPMIKNCFNQGCGAGAEAGAGAGAAETVCSEPEPEPEP